MLQKIKISDKIMGLIVTIVLVSILAMDFFTYQINMEAAKEKFNASLSAIADNQSSKVSNYFDHIESTGNFFQKSDIVKT